MKKEWKAPQLELLDISKTMGRWSGNTWDGFLLGRKYAEGSPGQEDPPSGS